MKKFKVRIVATITKTTVVEAENMDLAAELAHEQFSVLSDGTQEDYSQDTDGIDEVQV